MSLALLFQNMFGYAVKHHSKRADMEVKNNAQLTPLTLSSKLGRNEIFKEIIELQSIVSSYNLVKILLFVFAIRAYSSPLHYNIHLSF